MNNYDVIDIKDLIQVREEQVNYSKDFVAKLCNEFTAHNQIPDAEYAKSNVKRGLRNEDGTGIMAGLTLIGSVVGYYVRDGDKVPQEGKLIYRGIDVEDLIHGFIAEGRFGFEETAYLVLFGALPTKEQLDLFRKIIAEWSTLPRNFTEDMIIKAPSRDIMNKLGRSVLALYSYDVNPDDSSLASELFQAIRLISRTPTIVAHAYAVKRHYYDGDSLFLHDPKPELSIAENFLRSIRRDGSYTDEEAKLLDLCLVLHAEHGGGNNSAFACRVLSSSGTDIYSAISAAVGALKGPRHGGANAMVMAQFDELKANIKDWTDDNEVLAYLEKIIRKEAGNGSGLIYGLGHAVYTLSDPRVDILKKFARPIATQKGRLNELKLLESVERLAKVALNNAGKKSVICANVDLYSGLVYSLLGIPKELYTPLFAIARMVGWCAHRIEEVYHSNNKIIRPAYKSLSKSTVFVPLNERG
ncbi:MAG: citrate synthase [Oscillospiraceae bacterium]|jgi:citrate synthase|nr:citrate synthase [Oscillospiraceae bacterium]